MINLHVMFVDDEPDTREIIEVSLKRDPFFVLHGCASGREAVAKAVEYRPDLALVDVTMPDMDGPAVLAQLRADKRTAPIPGIFVTADEKARLDFAELGAVGVIAKPFDPLKLADQVRRFVPLEGSLAAARAVFLDRLNADACALSACRPALVYGASEAALKRINAIAHALAGAGGIYGFAGISCESAALSDVAKRSLAGGARKIDVEHALDRLLKRLTPNQRLH
jgi:CheY-like chemotaxis protein